MAEEINLSTCIQLLINAQIKLVCDETSVKGN
jgi:hypothetical protein